MTNLNLYKINVMLKTIWHVMWHVRGHVSLQQNNNDRLIDMGEGLTWFMFYKIRDWFNNLIKLMIKVTHAWKIRLKWVLTFFFVFFFFLGFREEEMGRGENKKRRIVILRLAVAIKFTFLASYHQQLLASCHYLVLQCLLATG